MTITNHRLLEAAQQIIPGGSLMENRRFLVMHYTAGMTAQSSVDFWKSKEAGGANAHIVIDRDGKIIQCRAFNRTAGHAGVSAWKHNGTRYDGLNNCSIGVELANAGDSVKNGLLFGKYKPTNQLTTNVHKWEPKVRKTWEEYSTAQLQAAMALAVLLVNTYNLDDVVGHEDIAPPGLRKHGDWKPDPGPLFPMQTLRNACGFTKPLGKLFP